MMYGGFRAAILFIMGLGREQEKKNEILDDYFIEMHKSW